MNITPSSTHESCPTCGRPASPKTHVDLSPQPNSEISSSATLVSGHLPQEDQVQFSIGLYKILNKIGQGGMGEVFLAYDTICGRRIALKKIRSDLLSTYTFIAVFLKKRV